MNKLRRSAKKPDDKGNRTERNSLLSKRGGGDKPKGDGPKGSAGSTTQNQPAPSELQRRGPAPSVTRNRHNNLFRPSADFLKNKRCYNCDELGHLAKDCLKPKRPRRQRSRWKDRVQSLVSSELYELRPTDEMSDDKSIVEHWKNTVEAFLSSVQWDDDSHSHADTPSHGETSTPVAAPGNDTVEDQSEVDHSIDGANVTLFDADKQSLSRIPHRRGRKLVDAGFPLFSICF